MEHGTDHKVNLFLIAPMRSGSTSMFHYLARHPQIYESPIKEPNFFVDELPESYFESSPWFDVNKYLAKEKLNPVHIARIEQLDQYRLLFKNAPAAKYRMEASTSYWLRPEACQKIKNYNPNSKIILLLRDPVKRMYSHYMMECGLGRERRSFAQAITDELALLAEDRLPAFSYIGLSRYDDVVQRFQSNFDGVHLVRLEDMTSDVEASSRVISEVLEVEPFPYEPFLHLNKSRKVLNAPLYRMLIDTGIKDYLRLLMGKSFRQAAYRAVSKINPPLPKEMDSLMEVETMLRTSSSSYYRPSKKR